MSIGVAMNPFGTVFRKFPVMVRFSKKMPKNFFPRIATSGRHNSAMVTDGQKFVTKITLYECIVSIFTVGINSKSFQWPVHSVQETSYQIFCDAGRDFTACQ